MTHLLQNQSFVTRDDRFIKTGKIQKNELYGFCVYPPPIFPYLLLYDLKLQVVIEILCDQHKEW